MTLQPINSLKMQFLLHVERAQKNKNKGTEFGRVSVKMNDFSLINSSITQDYPNKSQSKCMWSFLY